MAMNLNSLNVKVEQLFERAKQFGFTIQGELFDGKNELFGNVSLLVLFESTNSSKHSNTYWII